MLYYIDTYRYRVGLPPWRTLFKVGAIGWTHDVNIINYDYITNDLSTFKDALARKLESGGNNEIIVLNMWHFRRFLKRINIF